jgi:hypothetical protein
MIFWLCFLALGGFSLWLCVIFKLPGFLAVVLPIASFAFTCWVWGKIDKK